MVDVTTNSHALLIDGTETVRLPDGRWALQFKSGDVAFSRSPNVGLGDGDDGLRVTGEDVTWVFDTNLSTSGGRVLHFASDGPANVAFERVG